MDQAEQLRNIIKAQNLPKRPLARVITVTSGKGGVGKSNTAINLAIQFRKMGQRVIILDADFGLANIEIMFGAVPKHNLCDLIYQGKNIKEIITWGPMEIGFISGGSGISGLSNLGRDQLDFLVKNLAELHFRRLRYCRDVELKPELSDLYYPEPGRTGCNRGYHYYRHGRRYFRCGTGVSGSQRRDYSGHHTGTHFYYRFLFSAEGTESASPFFKGKFKDQGHCQPGGYGRRRKKSLQ